MDIIEYQPEYLEPVVELMTLLQDWERTLSTDRTPGQAMAAGHFEYLLDLCETQSGQVYLALEADEVIGFVVVFIGSQEEGDLHLLPEHRRYGWVSDLVVKEGYRGTGAASALMERAEQHCRGFGVKRVKLVSLGDNRRARRFYENAGYAEHEIVYCKDLFWSGPEKCSQ